MPPLPTPDPATTEATMSIPLHGAGSKITFGGYTYEVKQWALTVHAEAGEPVRQLAAAMFGPNGEFFQMSVANAEAMVPEMERDPAYWEGWRIVIIER